MEASDGQGARAIALRDRHYYAWTKQQAAALRALAARRASSTLDLENLAEEVEGLARSDLATVRSQLRRIIEHLLKLEYSPAAEPRFGSRESVIEARDVILDVITATLGRDAEAGPAKTYEQARRKADTALRRHGEAEAANVLPAACPYSFERIVGQDWYPQNRHGIVDDA